MVLLYSPTKQKPPFRTIVDLDYQGRGIAKIQGKTWFIENALPEEKIKIRVIEEKRQYGLGVSKNILQASKHRLTPQCQHYAQCGGCQNQHIPVEMQRKAKEKALYHRLAKLQPELKLMPMIVGDSWHYRRRVRLSLKFNAQSKRIQIGFRQRNSQDIINIEQCPVAESAINKLLPELNMLLQQWQKPKQLGHIEIVNTDSGLSLLLRHIGELSGIDRTNLIAFAQKQQLCLFLQEEEHIEQLYGSAPYYQLNDGIKLFFDIRDFIQVNAPLNQKMIDTALHWLELNSQDKVLDLFCGMGNFTLSISKKVNQVIGIEGVQEMVKKAQKNAEQNQCQNVQFYRADLAQPFDKSEWINKSFNKILLDPARSGVAFALQNLAQLRAEKILYVSCNPATLVRETEILIQFGYALKQVAMIDMFPHTGHLESISLFELK